MIKKFGIALIAAVVSTAALGAGYWWGLPIIGGASYCVGTVNGHCQQTVPAGPALTGAELIPADTNASGSLGIQTAYLSLPSIGAGTYQYVAPLTGATVTAVAANRQVIVEPAGTIAALTLVLPAATTLTDGQRLGFCSTQIVTTMTVTAGTGTTVSNPPTAMLVPVATGAGSCVEFLYRKANTNWYRVQ